MTIPELKNYLTNERIQSVFELRSHIRFLVDQLKGAEEKLNEGKLPNSAGIVQGQG